MHFLLVFLFGYIRILCGLIFGKHVFLKFLAQIVDNYSCNRLSKCNLVEAGHIARIFNYT